MAKILSVLPDDVLTILTFIAHIFPFIQFRADWHFNFPSLNFRFHLQTVVRCTPSRFAISLVSL